jgi:Protein of unknown function (DUF3489)
MFGLDGRSTARCAMADMAREQPEPAGTSVRFEPPALCVISPPALERYFAAYRADGAWVPSREISPEPIEGLGIVPAQRCPDLVDRRGTKLAEVLALLEREAGASIEELTSATGWLPHTTRAALTGLRKRAYTVLREGKAEVGSVYRITGMAQARAA